MCARTAHQRARRPFRPADRRPRSPVRRSPGQQAEAPPVRRPAGPPGRRAVRRRARCAGTRDRAIPGSRRSRRRGTRRVQTAPWRLRLIAAFVATRYSHGRASSGIRPARASRISRMNVSWRRSSAASRSRVMRTRKPSSSARCASYSAVNSTSSERIPPRSRSSAGCASSGAVGFGMSVTSV